MDKITTTKLFRKGGETWREVHSVDFNINGQSLHELTGARGRDMCGRFSSGMGDWNLESAKSLLLEGDPDDGLREGEFMLYVCPECADLGCGAIFCLISEEEGCFTWSHFGYDNGYEEGLPDYESYSHIGPFHFQKESYRATIMSATKFD